MKHIFLCRHAKSSWKDLSLHDHDRPLNKRGKRDAPIMGDRLSKKGLCPDLILSSPAVRALETARKLAQKVQYPKEDIKVMNVMYGASPDALLDLIHSLDDGVDTVFLVGHNPETTILANILGDLDIYNVPTCGIVALDIDVDSWKDVRKKTGILAFFDFPRNTE